MGNQPKLERLLRLLMMMSDGFGQSVEELAGKLNTSPRSVYRYIESLKSVGFIIIRQDNFLRVDKNSPYLRDIGDLLHFTKEEAWILNKAILALDDDTVIKQNLARKLFALYDLKGVPYPVVKKENSEKVIRLIRAIENKSQVILSGYHSSNSSTVSNRLVEPFEFTLNYGYIWCYEPESSVNKLFKTARIREVIRLETGWENEAHHSSGQTDVFRISGKSQMKVIVRLTLRAANLLAEEYPMAEDFIQKVNDREYLFQGRVSGFDGIGRFLLGLIDETEVLEPIKLKEYLDSKILNKKF